MPEKYKVIIDTDIGDDIDDAMALAYALRRPELDILGITTVFGPVEARARMAKRLLEIAGRTDIPVYAGNGLLLMNQIPVFDHLSHYDKSMDSATYDTSVHAVDFIIDTLKKSDGDITLVPIGAMTNIAMALLKCPAIKEKIRRIVWMGGAFYYQFLTWNALCDPDALRVVAESGVPISFISRDVCEPCEMTREQVEELALSREPLNKFVSGMISDFLKNCKRMPILFDPLTITAVFDKERITYRDERVLVETRGEFTRGMTFLARPFYTKTKLLPGYPCYEELPVSQVAYACDPKEYVRHYLDCMLNMPILPA